MTWSPSRVCISAFSTGRLFTNAATFRTTMPWFTKSSKIERVLASIGLIDVAAHFERTVLALFFSLVGAFQAPIFGVPVRSAWTTASMSFLVMPCTGRLPRWSTIGRSEVTYADMVFDRIRWPSSQLSTASCTVSSLGATWMPRPRSPAIAV